MDSSVRVADLAASRGASWLGQSFTLFRAKPFAWIGLCSGWIAITLGLIVLPIVGGVLANFLQPAFFASFAITAFRQLAGEPVTMGDLFSGFRRNMRSQVLLGAILLGAQLGILMLMALLGLPMFPPGDGPNTVAEYVDSLSGKEWILALGFVLTAIVKGALYFAPQLIAFHDMTVMHAIRWSVYAALSNIGAMMVYGFCLMGLFFAAIVPWALGLVVVIPLMAISTFYGYREVFEEKQLGSDSN
jgi:uncharacterized membrane protein